MYIKRRYIAGWVVYAARTTSTDDGNDSMCMEFMTTAPYCKMHNITKSLKHLLFCAVEYAADIYYYKNPDKKKSCGFMVL